MKLKEALKERIKERLTESTGLPDAPGGGNNSARWTPAGKERELSIPQLAGGFQVEKPVAEDPIPPENVPEGPDTQMDRGIAYQYNNKIRRDDDGNLTATGMPGEAYASPQEYVDDHKEFGYEGSPI